MGLVCNSQHISFDALTGIYFGDLLDSRQFPLIEIAVDYLQKFVKTANVDLK